MPRGHSIRRPATSSGTIPFHSSSSYATSSPSPGVADRNVEDESFEESRYWVWFQSTKTRLVEPEKGFLVAGIEVSGNPSSEIGNCSVGKVVSEKGLKEENEISSVVNATNNFTTDDQSKVITKGNKTVKKGFLVADKGGEAVNRVLENPNSEIVISNVVKKVSKKGLMEEDEISSVVNTTNNFTTDDQSKVMTKGNKTVKKGFLVAGDEVSENPSSEIGNSSVGKKTSENGLMEENEISSVVNATNNFTTDDQSKVMTKGNKTVKNGFLVAGEAVKVSKKTNSEIGNSNVVKKVSEKGLKEENESKNLGSGTVKKFSRDDDQGNKRVKKEENVEKKGFLVVDKVGEVGNQVSENASRDIVKKVSKNGLKEEDKKRSLGSDIVDTNDLNKNDERRVVSKKVGINGPKRVEKEENVERKGFLVADKVDKAVNRVSEYPNSDSKEFLTPDSDIVLSEKAKSVPFEAEKGFSVVAKVRETVNRVSENPDSNIVNKVSKKRLMEEDKNRNLGSDIVNNDNLSKDDQSKVMTKKAVTKGNKRVSKEENVEKKGFLVADKVGETVNRVSENQNSEIGDTNIVKKVSKNGLMEEDGYRNLDSDIVDANNLSKDEERRVVTKKAVSKGNKRVKKVAKFGKLGASDEAESESPENIVLCLNEIGTPNSDTVNDVNFSIDDRRTKGNKRLKKDENDREFRNMGAGDEADSESLKNIVSCSNEFSTPDSDIVNDVNSNADDQRRLVKKKAANSDIVNNVNANKKHTRVVRKTVVTKGLKRTKKENSDGKIEKLGVGDQGDTEIPKKIDSCSNEFQTSNSDIVNDNNVDNMRAEKKKTGTKGPKMVKKDEKDRELGSGQVSNEAEMERANRIEFQNPGSDIVNTGAEHGFNSNMDTNVGKEEKMESVATEVSERVQKEKHIKELLKAEIDNEPKTETPKAEMDNEPETESAKISFLGANEFQNSSFDIANAGASMSIESDCDGSGLMVVENVIGDTTNAKKEEKTVRIVRKKVVKKVPKKVKKEQSFDEKGKLEETELETPIAIESRNLNSDAANSCGSNLPGDKNHRSEVNDMDTEMANSVHDACENVNDNINSNADKEENNVRGGKLGSEGSEIMEGEKHQAESCDVSGVIREFTMADDVILSAQRDALERRKRRKTQIFLGGLDKDAVEEDVRKVFQEIGDIVEVTMKMNDKTGKNKGFAFVRYASAADAKKAVESSGKIKIFGKQCSVEFVKGNDTIYLGSIDKTWKNEDIVRLLQDAGVDKIDKVTIKPDPDKPECNSGYAFLELETIRDAQFTFGLLEKKSFLGNKKIRVEWAKQLSEADEEEMYKAKAVYAEYLPASWDEEAVKNHFKKFGEIENVALARNLVTSKRKDFAFVNYKTHEAALTCIKAYTYEPSNDENSKVHIKVSLAKSTPKTKQVKHASNPVIKISNKEKPTTAQTVVQSNQLRSKAVSTSHYYDNSRVVIQPQPKSKGELTSHHCDNTRASTNEELVQLLRAQASWRQPQTSLGIAGSTGLDYSHSLPAMKRQYSMGDPNYSDLRGYPRQRTDSALPALNPSVLYPDVRVQSLPHYHRQGLSPPSGLPYEVDGYFNRCQTRGGAASPGRDRGVYRRY